ncbi:MAG: T9SS type A sorting domain-containing protein [candidate division WOR-3 bacterium]|nr:T9SS type A sorting domain-containing protein [candidate division WOR-3 bacterium]
MFVSKSALSVCCCLLLCAAAGAQITITEGDIPTTIGDSFAFKICFDSTTVSVGPTGGPHVWTFDTAAFSGMVVGSEIVDKDSTPLGARFPDANITIQQASGPYKFWAYRKLDADQMLDVGAGMANADTLIGYAYSPPGVNLDLPLTFGTQWLTTFGHTDTTSDTTQSVILNIYDCRVDAWGTATCPVGTYPCLRENVFQTEITTSYLRGVIASAETVLTRRFYWHGPRGGVVAMAHSVEGDTNSSFTLADDYMVLVSTNFGAVTEERGLPVASQARILPNPCTGSATLNLAPGIPGPVTVRVCDATGRVVLRRALSVGRQASSALLDLRGNPAGLYICTVTAGSRIVTNEFVLLQ